LGLGQYQQGVVYAVKRGQAQGIPTHTAAQRRQGEHTQLENTNTQDKEDKACTQCEPPLRCVRAACQLTPACHTGACPQLAIQLSQHDSTCNRIPIPIQRARPNPHHARAPHQPRASEAQCIRPSRLRVWVINVQTTL